MIIVDLNQVCISNLMVQIGNHQNTKLEETLLRHMILNSIRGINRKFSSEYGELIIACDSRKNWRREVFPFYKANRRKDRDSSELDWQEIFQSLNKIRSELRDFFPYRVLEVEGAEADDVIATLCKKHGVYLMGENTEKILIVSGDKDFGQLQAYANVEQYDPVKKKFIKTPNPTRFIMEHIMRGDRGDGVPNFLSSDDCLVTGERQKPITTKKIEAWVRQKPEEFCDEKMLRGYRRNQQLIDFTFIPDTLEEEIMNKYVQEQGKNRSKLFNYFIEYKLKNLMEYINEF
jgi:5'-3' exonuclease